MKDHHFDVLIVGAGMVGSTLAIALASYNFKVAIFDKALPDVYRPEQLPDLRVSALSYASEQILRQLGAWQHIQAMRMCPYRKMAVWEKLNGGAVADVFKQSNRLLFDASIIHHEQLGFIVENRVTQLGLHRAMKDCSGIQLICPSSIKDIKVFGESPEIILNRGECFKGSLIVGADGANSVVRQAAHIGLTKQGYEQQCLVATVEIVGDPQDITWQAFTATGPESFLPLPSVGGKNYASIVWYHAANTIKRLLALNDADFIVALEKTFPKELPAIAHVHQRGAFPLVRQHAQCYYRKGVVLVGDAAHTINPLAGQGVNLGFQDIAWLAEILVDACKAEEAIGSAAVLARYQETRRVENLKMMMMMDGLYHTFSNNHSPLKLIRNIGLSLAGRLTPAVKQVMKHGMGLLGNQPKLARGVSLK